MISIDLPGFGQSCCPPEVWGSSDYARFIAEFVDTLGLTGLTVIGHSFGGKVGVYLPLVNNQLVERLVLVSSPCVRLRPGLRIRLKGRMVRLVRTAISYGPIGKLVADRFAEALGSADYVAATGMMRRVFVKVVNEDASEALSRVRIPTLIVWGAQDTETPLRIGQAMHRLLPSSELKVFPYGGHFVHLEELPEFCHLVRDFVGHKS